MLPKIETPTYSLKLPSTGKNIDFRPFTVGEEKVLMIASESGNEGDILRSIRDVARACTLNKLNINNITMYDFEYLFINIRAKSVGETAEVSLKCSDEECNGLCPITVDFSKVECVMPMKKVSNTFKINDKIGITLREITFEDSLNLTLDNDDAPIEKIIQCVIESVYDDDQIYKMSDCTASEINEFIDSLPHQTLEYIKEFIENSPTVQLDVKTKCNVCNKTETRTIKGIMDFF
jgi:hypothetical protein